MTTIFFDKQLYDLMAIKRVIAEYSDSFFSSLSQDDKNYLLEIEPKNNCGDWSKIVKDIKNKVVEEEVRISVENDTKDIRELIYKKAMNSVNHANEE